MKHPAFEWPLVAKGWANCDIKLPAPYMMGKGNRPEGGKHTWQMITIPLESCCFRTWGLNQHRYHKSSITYYQSPFLMATYGKITYRFVGEPWLTMQILGFFLCVSVFQWGVAHEMEVDVGGQTQRLTISLLASKLAKTHQLMCGPWWWVDTVGLWLEVEEHLECKVNPLLKWYDKSKQAPNS